MPENYQRFDEAYRSFEKIEKTDACPMCGSDKPTRQSFCSPVCAQKNSRKVDWDSIDLLALMKIHGISELEKMLGVSNAAIYKRRNKLREIVKGSQ